MIRICIVDDHYIVREGIRMVLELEEHFEVVAEAENGQQAIALLVTHDVDVILLDLNMPVMDGIQFLQQYKGTTPVIVLTTYNDEQLLLKAVNLGVRSYLLKDAGRAIIYETIARVMNGETYFPSALQHALRTARERPVFTNKELELLRLLASGLKNKEIASKLFVSERTVKAYLTTIYEKLDVKSRGQAIAIAIEQKYI